MWNATVTLLHALCSLAKNEAYGNRTRNLRVWNPTRYHCANAPHATAMRFELTRAKPSRFLVYRLNHSATLS